MHNTPLRYIDPTGHYCVSADGNWAHGGSCSGKSSYYLGEVEDLTGLPIISKGIRTGYLNIGITEPVKENFYFSENSQYYISIVDRGVIEDEQTWFVIEMLAGAGSLLKNLVKKGITSTAKKTGTVWDSIKATQPVYKGTKIPKSFEITAGKN